MPLEAIQPGATALTRTPAWAHSKAAVMVRLDMPARARREWPMPGMPLHEVGRHVDDRAAVLLHGLRNTSRIIRKPPVRLLATTASKPRLLIAISGAGNWPPALLTRPWMATLPATTSRRWPSPPPRRGCRRRGDARPPSSPISAATRSFSAVRPLKHHRGAQRGQLVRDAAADAAAAARHPMPAAGEQAGAQTRWQARGGFHGDADYVNVIAICVW